MAVSPSEPCSKAHKPTSSIEAHRASNQLYKTSLLEEKPKIIRLLLKKKSLIGKIVTKTIKQEKVTWKKY